MKLNNVINEGKNLYDIDNYNLDFNFESAVKELDQIVYKVLDKGSEYVIRSLPLPDQIKNVLVDVKDSIKKDGFKNIVKTAVNSSIEEGLQLLGIEKGSIDNIEKMREVAEKGGMYFNLEAAMDILKNNYTKNSISPKYIDTYFNTLNNYILSNDFANGITTRVKEYTNNVDKFLKDCTCWYKLYTAKDFESAKLLAENLNKDITKIRTNQECKEKNSIIQNVVKLSTNKSDTVTDLEMNLCQNLS